LSGLGEANEAGVVVLVFAAVVVVVVGIGVVDTFSSSFLTLGSVGADDGDTIGSCGVAAAAAAASFVVFAAIPMVAFSGKDLDLLGVHFGRDGGGSLSGLVEAIQEGVVVLVVATVDVEIVAVGCNDVVDSFSTSFVMLGSVGANDGATFSSGGVDVVVVDDVNDGTGSFDDAPSFCSGGGVGGGGVFSGAAAFSSTLTTIPLFFF
jgi:hypothetical protein